MLATAKILLSTALLLVLTGTESNPAPGENPESNRNRKSAFSLYADAPSARIFGGQIEVIDPVHPDEIIGLGRTSSIDGSFDLMVEVDAEYRPSHLRVVLRGGPNAEMVCTRNTRCPLGMPVGAYFSVDASTELQTLIVTPADNERARVRFGPAVTDASEQVGRYAHANAHATTQQ